MCQLMQRATSLMHAFEITMLLNYL